MSFQQWYNDIPVVTRVLFTSSFAVTLLASFGFLPAAELFLRYDMIVYNFQVWRLVTNFFIYGLGISFLMNMVFLFRYSGALENGTFAGRTADYLYFVILGCIVLNAIGLWWPIGALGKPMIIMLVYYWSRMNPSTIVSFFFALQFPAIYFPWALCAFNVLMGGSPIPSLIGIAVGHMYFFFEDVAPRTYGWRLIKTPQFLYNMMDPSLNVNSAGAPSMRARYERRQHGAWGTGRRLAD